MYEHAPCPFPLSGPRILYPEVLPDPEMVFNAHVIQPLDPTLTDELPVRDKAGDALTAEQAYEPLHDPYPFPAVGVPALVEQAEQYGERDLLVRDADDERVYVFLAELPVRAVHRQDIRPFLGKEPHHHPRHKVHVQDRLGHEALYAAHAGVLGRPVVKGGRELREVHRLDLAHGADKLRQTLDTG